VTPLNLYLRDASEPAALDAILDYGRAIRDLAAANIFPGDMLFKNFGVTRHGRVIFYDYDEVMHLTDCVIRRIPEPPSELEEMASEPWFSVADEDVFPEEFARFMLLPGPLGEAFRGAHGDLFTVEFWRAMQERHRRGDLVDFFPYAGERRLR
jgi:isocitrate dehydrogenase kinase/phosphatase